VLAGSKPVVGASVQVYSAGTTGNGAGAKALLSTPVTTDATGAFTVSSGLTCTSTEPMVYLVAKGGHVGTASDNAAIGMAAAIGDCSKLSTTTTTAFTVNEVTTVAFTWALAQFTAQGTVVGATSTNAVGLANAFANAANLADSVAGKAPGTTFPATGVAPTNKINSVANLLDNCIVVSTACNALFSATTVGGGSAPTNTVDAALQMARNPGNNIGVLYTQSVAATAFSPVLTAAPSDWTLSITYKGGGMNGPTGIGIDSKGYVWVASFNSVVSKFSPIGVPVFASGITGNGLLNSFGLAIDSSDNVWIPNRDSPDSVNKKLGSVTELNSNGQPLSGSSGFTAGGLAYPVALAVDPNGTIWVVNYNNARVTQLSANGAALSGATGYGAPSLAFIVSIAIDANHNAWIGGQNDQVVTRLSYDGTQSLAVTCCDGPQALALDQSNNVWITNFWTDSVSQITTSGAVISSGYSAGGLSRPQAVAVDGAGSVWALSLREAPAATNAALIQLAGAKSPTSPGAALSPASGWLADIKMLQPYAIAIDASGNLWISQYNSDNIITQVIGMAAPVKTPLIGPVQTP